MKKQKNKVEEDSPESHIIMDGDSLDEDFIKAIGRLTLNFAHLEFCFMLFAGSQMGVRQPLNQIVISELSFKQLLHISAAIFKKIETDESLISRFEKILKAAFILEQQRNTLIHSIYGQSINPKIIIRRKNTAKGKNGFREVEEIVDAESVNKVADKMNEVSIDLKKMIFLISSVQK